MNDYASARITGSRAALEGLVYDHVPGWPKTRKPCSTRASPS